MTAILIEKNVPLPVEEPKAPEPVADYPFGELEIGDSFVAVGLKKTALMTAFKAYAKANDLSWNVVVDNTSAGARIWRIEPEPDEDEEFKFDGIYRDADGNPRNDLYHTEGKVRTDISDGIYLDMPDYVYFAQDRLGSSDFSTLSSDSPEDWIWGSKHNEDVESSEVEEDLLFGKGLHCRVLEGEAAFDRQYVLSPHDSYVSKAAKEWKKEQLAAGLMPVKKKTYRNILLMSNLLINHPEVGGYLRGGLSEVVVLFTYAGLKVRAKFDKLLMDDICDLKSAGKHKASNVSPQYLEQRGISRDLHTCLRIIRDMKYSLQRYLYSLARTMMRDMIKNHSAESPLVHSASPAQMTWLQKLAEVERWNFVFLFARKVSHNAKNPAAPIITPIVSEMGDFMDEKGFKMLTVAVENYERLVAQFGLKVGWARVNPAYIADDVTLLEMFGADGDNPVPPEEDAYDEDGVIVESGDT